MSISRQCIRFLPFVLRFKGFFNLILILTVLPALLALTGCSDASGSSADDILAHTQKLHIADMTIDMALNTTYQGKPVAGSGKMKFVVDPARSDTILTVVIAGKRVTAEEVDDISASVDYVRLIDASNTTNNPWQKMSVIDNGLSFAQILAFDNLSNAHLVGAETQENVPVWHIRGDIIGQRSTSTGDVYIRKDTYYPVKSVISQSGAIALKTTLIYTGFNNGISIDIPQVLGG